MATARHKPRGAGRLPRRAAETRVPESMEFLIFQDHGGGYHWTIVARDGATLARSGSFASYDEAEQGAQHVRDGAGSAQLERRAVSARPVDLTARRNATSEDSDAERWLDDGGSFSSEAVERARPAREEPTVTTAMIHLCCPACRLRFSPAAAAYMIACPECGDSPQPMTSLERGFGFRLVGPQDLPHELPYATAVSIIFPEPGARS